MIADFYSSSKEVTGQRRGTHTMTGMQNTMTGMQNARPFSAKPSGAIQPLQKPVLSQN